MIHPCSKYRSSTDGIGVPKDHPGAHSWIQIAVKVGTMLTLYFSKMPASWIDYRSINYGLKMQNPLHTEKYVTFSRKYVTFSLFFHSIFLMCFRKFLFMAVVIMINHDRNRYHFKSGRFQMHHQRKRSRYKRCDSSDNAFECFQAMSFPIFFPWAEFQMSPLQPLWQVLFNVRWNIASFVAIKILTHLGHTSIFPNVLHVGLNSIQKVIHVDLCRRWCLQATFLLMFHEPKSQTCIIHAL